MSNLSDFMGGKKQIGDIVFANSIDELAGGAEKWLKLDGSRYFSSAYPKDLIEKVADYRFDCFEVEGGHNLNPRDVGAPLGDSLCFTMASASYFGASNDWPVIYDSSGAVKKNEYFGIGDVGSLVCAIDDSVLAVSGKANGPIFYCTPAFENISLSAPSGVFNVVRGSLCSIECGAVIGTDNAPYAGLYKNGAITRLDLPVSGYWRGTFKLFDGGCLLADTTRLPCKLLKISNQGVLLTSKHIDLDFVPRFSARTVSGDFLMPSNSNCIYLLKQDMSIKKIDVGSSYNFEFVYETSDKNFILGVRSGASSKLLFFDHNGDFTQKDFNFSGYALGFASSNKGFAFIVMKNNGIFKGVILEKNGEFKEVALPKEPTYPVSNWSQFGGYSLVALRDGSVFVFNRYFRMFYLKLSPPVHGDNFQTMNVFRNGQHGYARISL